MRRVALIAIVLLVLAGAGYGLVRYLYVYPIDVADQYISNLVNQNYQELESYFHSDYPSPEASQIEDAYGRFGEAYGLTNIELIGINPIEESFREAEYVVDMRYESNYFEPLFVQFNLELAWDEFFTWKVLWDDILPVPEYGLNADYMRSRIEPARGHIYDRSDSLLAGRGSVVSIGVQPGRITDHELLVQVLEDNLNLSPDYVSSRYQAPGVQDHWFVPLLTVTEQEYQALDPILRPVPGIFFQRQPVRYYPEAAAAAHITGYLGEVDTQVLQGYPQRDYQIGETVGRSGLELAMEAELRGKPGYQLYVEPEDDWRSMYLETPVEDGTDISLTIDAQMQRLAYDVLADVKGSMVVLDATSGEILVLAASPSYDPNEFIMGISDGRWAELSSDPLQPLFNRVLQGRFPLGSVFKVITASAALDQGLYSIDSNFEDTGELLVEGNIIRNFEYEIFGEHQFDDAVIKSINTTMAKVGLQLGADTLVDYFTRWQLDQIPELALQAARGQIGNPGRSKVSLAWTSIGQDQVLLTPLHVASIFTVFVNEGHLPEIALIRDDREKASYQVLESSTVEIMDQLLHQVVLAGTGRQAAVEGLKICGKTGTAETGSDLPHAWFAGYVDDLDGSNLAFAVIVEEGGVGGQTAAPLVSEYFTRLLEQR